MKKSNSVRKLSILQGVIYDQKNFLDRKQESSPNKMNSIY